MRHFRPFSLEEIIIGGVGVQMDDSNEILQREESPGFAGHVAESGSYPFVASLE